MSERLGFGLISDSVGNNLRNNENDVFAVKTRLARAGVFDPVSGVEPHGFITREMDDGIKAFQRRENLRVDGVLFPGGETEGALLKSTSARGLAFAHHTDSGDGEESTEGDGTPVPPVKPEPPAQENPPADEDTKPDRDKREEDVPNKDDQKPEEEHWRCPGIREQWAAKKQAHGDAVDRNRDAQLLLKQRRRELEALRMNTQKENATNIPTAAPPGKGRRGRVGLVLDGVQAVVGVSGIVNDGREIKSIRA